jgi:hypothetical protein
LTRLGGAVLLAAAVMSASGCGGDESGEDSQLLPHDVGSDLVRKAERVQTTLDRDDSCTALDRAQQLRQAVERAIERKRVPPALQDELRRRSAELEASIVCIQPPPPPPPPAPARKRGEEREEDD